MMFKIRNLIVGLIFILIGAVIALSGTMGFFSWLIGMIILILGAKVLTDLILRR